MNLNQPTSQNMSSTDSARMLVLQVKARSTGLQESEKDELAQLIVKSQQAK